MKNFEKNRKVTQGKRCMLSRILIALLGIQLIFALNVYGQQTVTVSGTVTDAQGQPLPGATVMEEGTTNGTVTNSDGVFTINVSGNATLVFSFVGMSTQRVPVNSRSQIDIRMEEETIGMEEIVVVGYGEMSRRNLTTSISSVKGEELQSIPISTVGEGLKGKIPGVRVHQTNFTPGAEPTFTIRGGSSIQKSNQPLVLVDGVEISFKDINPNDIESIEVLKDAASTSIYGSRASNGVILVTTRKGSVGAPKIIFEATVAYQEPERFYKFLPAAEEISIKRIATAISPYPQRNHITGYPQSSGNTDNSIFSTRYLAEGESVPDGYKSMLDPLDPSKTLIFQDNDYTKLIAGTSMWQKYNLGVNGGTENIRYSGSIGYIKDDGVALGTGYKRLNARFNTDIRIADNLSFSSGINFSESSTDEYSSQRDVISRGLYSGPTQKMYWADGRPTPGVNSSSPNPLWYTSTRTYDNLEQRFTFNSSLSYNISEGLVAIVTGSIYRRNYQDDYFELAHEFSSARNAESNYRYGQIATFEPYINYIKNIFNEDHSLNVTAGLSYTEFKNKSLSAGARGASTDKIHTLNAAPDKYDATTSINTEVLAGTFGRLSYSYLNKYLFSATIRADGSSRFPKGEQWGYFPGISLGWIMSEEPVFENLIDNVGLLKLRASLGQTGNNTVGLYDAFGTYGSTYKYDGTAGIRPSSMPNRALTWETTTQTDIGIDLAFLNNRIEIISDYFNKHTEGLIFSVPLPNTAGFSNVEQNIGKVKFYGFEFEVKSNNINTRDFNWNSTLSWSFVKNKVLKLPDNGRDGNRIGGWNLPDGTSFGGIAEGEPLYRIFGYKVSHILETQEEADAAHYDEIARGWDPVRQERRPGSKAVGMFEWIDKDGNGRINEIDQFEVGRTAPHSTGGLGNIFQYKKWSLNIYMDYAIGHSIYDESWQRFLGNTMSTQAPIPYEVKNFWTQPGDGPWPKFVANDLADGGMNFRRSDFMVQDASYLCIRNITLQYTIPETMIKRFGLNDLALNITGNNLHYFTDVEYISPETGTESTYSHGYFPYPPVRSFSIGVKIGL